jgi:antitoxin (DNA-binding transcriptional repressor) of toxin-antitoxin stability system
MEANVLDMRRNPKRILDAIARNETVTLLNRGKAVASIVQSQRASRFRHVGGPGRHGRSFRIRP